MGHSILSRFDSIRSNQNEALFAGVRYSAFGSITAAFVLLVLFQSLARQYNMVGWCAVLCLVYAARWADSITFRRSIETSARHVKHWQYRFNTGAILAALLWASTMWLIYPSDPGHQVLLILTLVGVASGSIASLPYDKWVLSWFQAIIFVSVELRLLVAGDTFSLELAFFNVFIFGFIYIGGQQVSENYQQLMRLRQHSQEHNLSLIRTTEEVARMGYWQWDMHSEEIELSENLAVMWQFDQRRISITAWMAVVHAEDVSRVKKGFASVYGTEGESSIEYRMLGSDAEHYRDMNQITKCILDSDGKELLLGTVQDISALKSAEQKLYRMAFFDELTGLSNRGHFHEQLKTQILLAQRSSKKLAVVFIDLDDFKGINDSYGHEVGDNYLRTFATHIKSSVRASDISARLGGDEFCIVLQGVQNKTEVARITEICLKFTKQTVVIDDHRIQPKLSVGVSLFPEDGSDANELLKNADMAMYSVKQNGKHGYRFFEPEMITDTTNRVRLEASLRQAIDNDQFELWYQPKVALDECRLSGVEALIRWRHPEKGIISPDVFIATAERVGMINEIGEWVLETSCKQLRKWHDAGLNLQMAINISGGHFVEDNFCESVLKVVEKNNLKPGDLEVEITESMTRDPQQHSRVCQQLRSAGVRIAIDDFGTGYSSLSVLDKLDVDTLKIDRSFIMGLPDDISSILLVKAIMELSLGLGYDVVAEGVETEAQLQHLKALNCPFVQGYYFSKAVTAEEVPLLVMQNWSQQQAA